MFAANIVQPKLLRIMHGNANMNKRNQSGQRFICECLHFSDDDGDDDNLCHLPMCACKNSNKYMDMEYNVAAAFCYSSCEMKKCVF